ncbi:MAG: hypothetical protein ACRDG7_15485 [Candidatus Limnocylindria bacterium]
MAKAKAPRKTDADADPDKLVRQKAGTYRTADDRFEVREADVGWFLVDPEQTNEFGQELIQGPFTTLKAVREALPDARAAKPTPKPPPKTKAEKPARTAKAEPKPEPPPRTWIDELPKAEAGAVRRLIGALERDGIDDAEALVRQDRDGLLPAVATRLIERRLEEIADELPEQGRAAARDFVQRVAKVLSSEGRPKDPLPGWTLVEVGPEPEPPNRRIDLRT